MDLGRMSIKGKENIILREIEGEYILVPISRNFSNTTSIYKLNKTSVYIWDLIKDNEVKLTKLAHNFSEKFKVDEETALNDVNDLLYKLNEYSLIELNNEAD
ncbi:PqqD family protein [Alkalicella caledoniensis]|uniref:PqqD family protein n=1 Tax=Alkalicella caledoniensis TaxID=2731377 RepID=A0A7G9WA43_ALKCA|nr:PqqD family protein [Alkalicella caledoniensis]QNO15555.1 PqqD family protein [Alkalicella caledoniensis]